MNEMHVLGSLREGESARVERIVTEGSMGRRLLDLGLTEGTRVTCVQKAPSGDPAAYLIRGAVVALRRTDADGVVTAAVPAALTEAGRTALA